jgi:DNA-binding XRE family transcriptional regulator
MLGMRRHELPKEETPLAIEIRRMRKDRGMSQEALADKVEVSRKTIVDWESGKTEPSDDKLDALARHIGLSRQRAYELMRRVPGADLTEAIEIIKRAETETDQTILLELWRRLRPGSRVALRRLVAAGLVEGSEQEQGVNGE